MIIIRDTRTKVGRKRYQAGYPPFSELGNRGSAFTWLVQDEVGEWGSWLGPAWLPVCALPGISPSLQKGFPGGSDSKKNQPVMQETWVPSWVGKIAWRLEWPPTPVFLSGESHAQRSLVGYSPWGCKESDMTKRLTLSYLSPSLHHKSVGLLFHVIYGLVTFETV